MPQPIDESLLRGDVEQPAALPRRKPPMRVSAIITGAALGSLLSFVVVLLVSARLSRGRMPPLSSERLASAQRQWDERGPSDYDIELQLSGRQTGRYHVEVRDGRAVAMTRNGVAPPRRVWPQWTVPGLFEILEHDLVHVDDPEKGFGMPKGSTVLLRAVFDERFGYPRKYARTVLGTALDEEWDVTGFAVVADDG